MYEGGLHVTADDFTDDIACDFAIDDLEFVRVRVGQVKALLYRIGKKREAARNQQRLNAVRMCGGYELFGTGVELQTLVKDFLQYAGIRACVNREATAQ